MSRRIVTALALLALAGAAATRTSACSLCGPQANTPTFREDVAAAKLVVFGTLANPRLSAAVPGASPEGAATDLHVEQVIKSHPILAGRTVLTLPRYVPVDAKNPPKFLVFCDVANGKLDPYRGSPVRSPDVLPYVTGAAALRPDDPAKLLGYFFRYLDHPDPDVAADAFREFTRAGDADIARAAPHLDPAKLRKLLADPATPPARLALFAYLLGGCGTAADADWLARQVRRPDDRGGQAYSGLLAGYTQLRPDDGWAVVAGLLADPRQPAARRLAALATVRFFYRSQPAARPRAVQAVTVLLPQSDLADLAVEDLRQWREWGPVADVLGQYGKKTHEAPMVRRAIVRYALTCPRPEAKAFIDQLRRTDPRLVRDVEESLQFETAGR